MASRAQPYELTPVLVDVMLQCFCQGIIFVQLWTYRRHYSDDPQPLKCYVFVLGFASFVQTVFIIYMGFQLLIIVEENSESRMVVTTTIDILVNGIICTLCQSYLIRRCWKVTGNRLLVLLPLSVLAGATFVADAFFCVSSGFGKYIDNKFIASVAPAILFWVFGTVALDIIITAILIVYLWRSRTGLSHVDHTLKNISHVTWSTSAIPCVLMIIAAIIHLVHTHNPSKHRSLRGLELFFILITGKFYVLGLLLTINSRGKWRERMKSHVNGRVNLSDWDWVQEHDSRSGVTSTSTEPLGEIHAVVGPKEDFGRGDSLSRSSTSYRTGELQQKHSTTALAMQSMDTRELSLSSRRSHMDRSQPR